LPLSTGQQELFQKIGMTLKSRLWQSHNTNEKM
jgi:hypothetical protein